jgi:hypothetical protein
MSKFTPGPWVTDKYGNLCTDPQKSVHTRIVFAGITLSSGPVAEANAKLAGDAPALLDVLMQIVADLPNKRDWLDPVIERQARALIAKHRE